MTIGLSHYLFVSGLLFTIGLVGLITRRNAIMMLLSVEILFNAANLALVAFSRAHEHLTGQIFVFFIIIVAAAEVTVGLAIVLLMSRRIGTIQADEVRQLRW